MKGARYAGEGIKDRTAVLQDSRGPASSEVANKNGRRIKIEERGKSLLALVALPRNADEIIPVRSRRRKRGKKYREKALPDVIAVTGGGLLRKKKAWHERSRKARKKRGVKEG